MAVDPDFGLDNFNQPKILNDSQTLVNNILMLLFMRPGSYPSLPHLGINIQQYLYKFFDEIDTNEIKAQIVAQCSDFLDTIQNGSFDVYKTTQNNTPVLLLVLPVRVDDAVSSLVIGITLSNIGDLIFNFQFDKTIIS